MNALRCFFPVGKADEVIDACKINTVLLFCCLFSDAVPDPSNGCILVPLFFISSLLDRRAVSPVSLSSPASLLPLFFLIFESEIDNNRLSLKRLSYHIIKDDALIHSSSSSKKPTIMENSFFSSALPISYHGYPSSLMHPNELDNNVTHPLYLSFHEHEQAMQNQALLSLNPNFHQGVFPSDVMNAFNPASASRFEDMSFPGSRESGFCGSFGEFINQQSIHRPYNELSLTLGRNDPRNPNSRYMEATEQILSEITSYALENMSELEDSVSTSCSSERADAGWSSERNEFITLLEMVDEGYNRFLLQIQSVVKKFQLATNSEAGQTAAHLAMREISRFHRSLREKITAQIVEEERSFASSQAKNEQQTWRPQRGLPEKSVAVLRAWMFQNFLHPYPKDSDKHILAIKSGLTRSQVSNWFINARVRLWKPMIEEMHSEVCKKEQAQDLNGDLRGRLRVGDQRVG